MRDDPLVGAFERLVAKHPGQVLVASPTRHATLSDVDGLARRATGTLERNPLALSGRVVALLAANGPGFLGGLIALRRAGAVTLLIGHRTPPAELERIAASLGGVGALRCGSGWRGEDRFVWQPAGNESTATDLAETDAAVIKLSSGSTGTPRGVASSIEALMADDAALRATMDIRRDDRLLASVPFPHSYGLSSLVLPALAAGIRLIVPDSEAPLACLETAHAAEATFFPTVPAYVDAWLKMSDPPPAPRALRRLVTAGAPIRPDTAAAFRERIGAAVHVFYGASECGGICFDREGGAAERGSVGTPVDGVRVRLETESGGSGSGRVIVESPAVGQGYLPDPDERLGDGRYVTDDLAAWKDGELVLCGRLGRVINVKGKKVDPCEVESVLGDLQHVEEVYVVGLAVPGRSEQTVRAVIACRPGALSAADVLGWCRARLNDYKVPRSVVFVPSMPRTERGKIDRAALARLSPERERVAGPDG